MMSLLACTMEYLNVIGIVTLHFVALPIKTLDVVRLAYACEDATRHLYADWDSPLAFTRRDVHTKWDDERGTTQGDEHTGTTRIRVTASGAAASMVQEPVAAGAADFQPSPVHFS